MIPSRQRRIIAETFDTYGRDIKLVMDERVSEETFYVVGEYGEELYVKGSVRYINWARDYLNNSLVPETYSDEATTWG